MPITKRRINSKQKGNRWERECAKFLQRWWPEARRQTYDQSRKGNEQPDVMGTPFWVECKAYKKVTQGLVTKWIEKMKSDNTQDLPMILFIRDTAKRETTICLIRKPFDAAIFSSFDIFAIYCARLVESEGK